MTSQTEIEEILKDHYGIAPSAVDRLDGYDCENFAVTTDSGKYVLKLTDADSVNIERLRAETHAMRASAGDLQDAFPVAVENIEGETVGRDKIGRLIRLLTFVDGMFLAEADLTEGLYESFGRFLAEMDKRLFGFCHPAIEAKRIDWDLQHYRLNEKLISNIPDAKDRALVEYFFLQNRENVEPVIEELRRSVIHGDAHEENVLTKNGEVSGIIDFDDVVNTQLINELAIAVSYALFFEEETFQNVIPLIRSYNDVIPLEEKELEVLYYLIATRLCMSVCHSAEAKTRRDDEYVTGSEEDSWRILRSLVEINPKHAEDVFRGAAGLESKIVDTIEADREIRDRHTSRALSLTFDKPIKMERAAFQYMYDSLGNSYLDCYNNIPQVGHCHPKVVEAGQNAMARLNTNTRYLNDVFNEYAENLLGKFPHKLSKVFFVNSGSAASDLAIRLAMKHTGNMGVVVMEHGYHGNTRLGIDISHYKYNRKGGRGRTEFVIESPIPDVYKGVHRGAEAGQEYAATAIERMAGVDIAAFLAEPVVGCGGQVPLADGYLKEIYPAIRERGGVCISDEVQTGFGRLGLRFWGFEMHGVEPDIVIMGKPMGNGHPVAAVVTTDEIAASFETGMEFFSSFGGNPVSLAIAQAVLDVLEEERLQENAETVGGYLLSRLKTIVERYEVAGDARGAGLFLGLELIKDGDRNSPNTKLAATVRNELREKGILVGIDGPDENVIKIKPPICFTKENADRLAAAIEESIK